MSLYHRFTISDSEGRFVANVYADKFEIHAGCSNSYTGAVGGGHFYRGDSVCCWIEPGFQVADSGGILVEDSASLTPEERMELVREYRAI